MARLYGEAEVLLGATIRQYRTVRPEGNLSAFHDIERRLGPESHVMAVGRALDGLLNEGSILATGERRWRTYRVASDKGQA